MAARPSPVLVPEGCAQSGHVAGTADPLVPPHTPRQALALLLEATYGDGEWRFTHAVSDECRRAWVGVQSRAAEASHGSKCWRRVLEAAVNSGAARLAQLAPTPLPPRDGSDGAESRGPARAEGLRRAEEDRLLALALAESMADVTPTGGGDGRHLRGGVASAAAPAEAAPVSSPPAWLGVSALVIEQPKRARGAASPEPLATPPTVRTGADARSDGVRLTV